jgi:outer membrane lipoprotein carrier protein
MKKITFIAVLFLFTIAVQAQNDVKAGQILESVSQKYKTVSAFKANFTILRESSANGVKPETDLGAIKVKGSKYHIKLKEQEVFNNGNTVWTYLKKGNEATITDYMPDDDALSPTNIYAIYKKGYKYVFVEEAKEAGQTYEVVDLIPEKKNQQVYKIKLTIDKKTKTLKRWKVFEKNGNRYTYTINDFVPLNIEDKDFVFDKAKYPGVAIEDLR